MRTLSVFASLAFIAFAAACESKPASHDSPSGAGGEPAAARPASTVEAKESQPKEQAPPATDPSPSAGESDSADTSAPSGWQKVTSPEGGYSILAPTKGIAQTTSTSTPAGPANTVTVLYQNEGDPGALMVMYMDMPVPDGTPLAVEQGLEDGRDRAVGTYNGTLTRDERIAIDGFPGREFEFDATMPPIGPVHAIMRGAFRDKRVYMIGAVARKGDRDFFGKGVHFVRSFTILPYTAAPAPEKPAK